MQLAGRRWSAALLRALGWQLQFDGLPARQGVLIFYPHTSNWDFPLTMLAKSAIGMPAHFWVKSSLFGLPLFGRWLRWLGGLPVERSAPQGAARAMADRFVRARAQDDFLWLALSPEGTRRRGEGWRSGFYQVALAADVPLALGYIDYAARRLGVLGYLRLSGDRAADMAAIAARLAGVRGLHPEAAAPVKLLG